LALVHATSNAPSQPAIRVGRPEWTAIVRSCGSVPPGSVTSRLTSTPSPSRLAARRARGALPMTRTRPADAYETEGTGSGGGSCAAAISAAIFGSAAPRSLDQPPVSRMLTKRIGRSLVAGAPSVASASSTKRRLSCVHATSRSSDERAARWNAAASRRHSSE
jgi:hypothetical protein